MHHRDRIAHRALVQQARKAEVAHLRKRVAKARACGRYNPMATMDAMNLLGLIIILGFATIDLFTAGGVL